MDESPKPSQSESDVPTEPSLETTPAAAVSEPVAPLETPAETASVPEVITATEAPVPSTETAAVSEPVAPAEAAETPPTEPLPPVTSVTSPGERGNRTASMKWLFGAFLIIILVGIGYGLWQHFKKSTPKTVTTTEQIPLLRFGSIDGPIGPDNVFPNAIEQTSSSSIDFQVFEGLVGYKGENIVPLLATSWTNPDKNTWVFTIAQGVKFQNGTLLTPTIVASSLNADVQSENYSSYFPNVSSVKVTGANQVTITTSQPDSLLLDRLVYGFIYTTSTDGKTYYGTGPYTIDTSKPYTDTLTSLKAFDGYHGGVPMTREVTYSIYSDTTKLTKDYLAGKIDQMELNGENTDASQFGNKATIKTYELAGSYGLRLNIARKNSVFANKQVREALSYAIDRDSEVKQLSTPVEATLYNMPASTIGYDASATVPAYNLAKAKQLLAAAGYGNGVPIDYIYIAGAQEDAPIIIKQLQAAGFQVKADPQASVQAFVTTIESGNYDMFGSTYFSDYNDALDIYTQILGSESDFPTYSDPAYDALIQTADQAFDPTAHVQAVQAINRYIASNDLWIPIHTADATWYTKPSYQLPQNFTVSSFTNYYWRVGQTVTTTTK